MPLYPAFLALLYDPAWSDDEFFVRAKQQSIVLSLVLLVLLGAVSVSILHPLPAVNLVLIVMFGYFIFRAGYVQSELLYYALHFLTFVALWQLLRLRTLGFSLWCGAVAGALAALAHLTKASVLPLVALFLLIYILRELGALIRTHQLKQFAGRLTAIAILVTVFLGILAPYLANSKRVHGRSFYNLNTTALIWYDNWPQASVAILDYGPDGWPKGPRRLRPGPVRYWREHTLAQISARFAGGSRDMVVRSYHTFWYFKFVAIYLLAAAVSIATTWQPFRRLARRHACLVVFCALYAAIYLPAVAFYEPISGYGHHTISAAAHRSALVRLVCPARVVAISRSSLDRGEYSADRPSLPPAGAFDHRTRPGVHPLATVDEHLRRLLTLTGGLVTCPVSARQTAGAMPAPRTSSGTA